MIFEFILWWIIAEVLGFLALPFAIRIFTNLSDSGYPASKLIGISVFSYFSWILGFAFGFTRAVCFISIAILFLLSAFIFFRRKDEITKKLRQSKELVIKTEILFFLLFLLFASTRASTPDILGLEKFMDSAFLNSMAKNSQMPPMDPWFSGASINYYYFGHFITASLTKLSGIGTNYTYNLMLAMYYALFSLIIFSIAFNLTKKLKYGIFGILVVAILGNSFGLVHLAVFAFPSLAEPLSQGMGLEYPVNCCWNPNGSFFENVAGWPLWPSTRIIPDTINEFPSGTFLFGDLHAHFMGFSFQALLILLILNLFREKKLRFKSFQFLSLPFFLGMSSVVNSWDFAVYSIVIAAALLIRFGKKESIKITLVSVAVGMALFSPFYLSLHPPPSYFNIVHSHSGFFQLLIIYSFPLLSAGFYFFQKSSEIKKEHMAFAFFFSIIASYALGMYSLIFIVPALLASFIMLKARLRKDSDSTFVLVMIAVATILLLSTDIAVIDSADNSRFNAVFKLFLPIWILYGISSVYIISRIKKTKIFTAALSFLIFANMLTPFFAEMAFVNTGSIKGLDGTAYIEKTYPGDYNAIQWIKSNLGENDVVLEIPGRAYTYDSRISSISGVPTVIGWVNHEFVWRGAWFSAREADVNTIYNTTDNNLAYELLKKYNVTYIYVGALEREKYSSNGLGKFDDYYKDYRLVFDNGSKIYQFILR